MCLSFDSILDAELQRRNLTPVERDAFLDATARDRVEAGAVWLDEAHPGWERKIDVAALAGDFINEFYPFWRGQHADPEYVGMYPTNMIGSRRLGDGWTELIKRRFDTGVFSDS